MNEITIPVKLRRASGVHVFTVPAEIVKAQGWKVGQKFKIKVGGRRRRGK